LFGIGSNCHKQYGPWIRLYLKVNLFTGKVEATVKSSGGVQTKLKGSEGELGENVLGGKEKSFINQKNYHCYFWRAFRLLQMCQMQQ